MTPAAAPIDDRNEPQARAQPAGFAFANSVALVVVIALGLRLGTNITSKAPTFDESWIIVPINDLLQQGWSVKTAIDFEETKGPGMIWLYALAGKVVGSSLNELRLVSVVLFVLGVVPLLDLARRCGIRGPSMMVVAMLYALLPYHAPLSQLVMSEGSFVAFTIAACWVAIVGLSPHGADGSRLGRGLYPVVFGLLLSILLHNRVHAVALAGAVTLTAMQTLGWRRSWPWIAACALAGISRIPLWLRWGGLVSPRWQSVMELGFGLDGMAYLLATLAPVLAVFVWAALSRPELRSRWWWLALAGACGGALIAIAPPNLAAATRMEDQNLKHFSGIVATVARTISPSPTVQTSVLACLGAASAAGMLALWMISSVVPVTDSRGVGVRLQSWLVLVGLALYALTNAPAFDRYVLGWIVLLPIVWAREMPRAAVVAQAIALTGIAGWLCRTWLM